MDTSLLTQNLTDVGNAERLIALYGSKIKYVTDTQTFLVWSNWRWMPDNGEKLTAWMMDVAKLMLTEATAITQTSDHYPRKQELVKFALKSESASLIRHSLDVLKGTRSIWAHSSEFDTHDHLLNCQNGTVDLRTGTIQPHRPADKITVVLPVRYDSNAPCPNWLAHLGKAFENNQSVIDYVQTAIGYTLTGSHVAHAIFICRGHGENGKSVILDTIGKLMGPLAVKLANSALLSEGRNPASRSGATTPDMVPLIGKRYAQLDELEGVLHEQKVKALTGSEKYSGRAMYSDQTEWVNHAKLWFDTNNPPSFSGIDRGIARRFHVIPFAWQVPAGEKVKDGYAETLIWPTELPGVLAWAVQGAIKFYQKGLDQPDTIREATDQYIGENNNLPAFARAMLKKNPSSDVSVADFQAAYEKWCARIGTKTRDTKTVAAFLRGELGAIDGKSGSVRKWKGIELKPTEGAS